MNKNTLIAIILAVFVSACSDAKKESFISKCKSGGETEVACDCAYDIAETELDDKQLDLFIAMSTGDNGRAAAIGNEIGPLSMIMANAKVGVVLGKAAKNCNLKM